MVTGPHLHLAHRGIYLQALHGIDELLLVHLARFLKSLSNEVGGHITVKSGKPRRKSISVFIGLDKCLISRGIGIVEVVVHGTHHPLRGFRPEWLEHGVIRGGVNPNGNLPGHAGRFGRLQDIGHAAATGSKDNRIGFGRFDGGKIGYEVGFAYLPP